MKVLVLGAGKMVEAILLGLMKSEDLSSWMIYSPSGTSAQNLAKKTGATSITDLGEALNPDWILLGCKPQQLLSVKEKIADRFNDCLFVSMLAASSEGGQLNTLKAKSLVRMMPNLSVAHGKGITLLSSISAKDKLPEFERHFKVLGEVVVLSDAELDELTLLTGSAQAFMYEFLRALSTSFHSLTDAKREDLVRRVLLGAAESISQSNKSLSEMTDEVTSKGGVTIAVLNYWRENGFLDLVKKGISRGKARIDEIKKISLLP